MLQRQISIDRDETETGLEALEEPLKARKRRESRQGISQLTKAICKTASTEHIFGTYANYIL